MDGSIVCARLRQCEPHVITGIHTSNGISIGSAVFAQLTAEWPYTLQCEPLSSQNRPFAWVIWTPPSNTWFLGPTQIHNPNGISIDLAVFAGLTIVTDRQTLLRL